MSSLAQLLMNRRLRTDLPTTHNQLRPQLTDHRHAVKVMEERKLKQKQYYDRSTRSLKPLHKDDSVRLYQKGKWKPAVVISPTENTSRSYRVQTPNGSTLRRNRRHLLQNPSPEHRVPSSRKSRISFRGYLTKSLETGHVHICISRYHTSNVLSNLMYIYMIYMTKIYMIFW